MNAIEIVEGPGSGFVSEWDRRKYVIYHAVANHTGGTVWPWLVALLGPSRRYRFDLRPPKWLRDWKPPTRPEGA